ncbi:MAG: hypothetical protein IIC99_07660 [Chloroflexi bacterium]|nr:hypothetical protein [Chloroflexota bacterium]
MKLADLRDATEVDLPVLSITVIAGLMMAGGYSGFPAEAKRQDNQG